jgi:hypothetical protein
MICVFVLFIGCTNLHTPKLTDSHDWQSLFNGKDLTDWIVKIHHHEVGDNFANTFRVEDGVIKVSYDQYDTFNERFGHLFYKSPFSAFHLRLDYKLTGEFLADAPIYALLNSGVMYHSQAPDTILVEQDWPISVEMQFLAGLEDGKPRPTGNMCSPGTDIVYQEKIFDQHCLRSTSPTISADEWVSAELIVSADGQVKHIINGKTVLEYSQPQIDGDHEDHAKRGELLTSGYIALQSEGQPIEFKNITIRKLD